MKRKITDLEKQLIADGFVLSFKQYHGKHSEKTLSYTYIKENWIIKLDKSREKVLGFYLNNIYVDLLDYSTLIQLNQDFHTLNSYVSNLIDPPSKPTFVPVSEYDESEEIPNGLTPEQFDELCQEKEQQQKYEEMEK